MTAPLIISIQDVGDVVISDLFAARDLSKILEANGYRLNIRFVSTEEKPGQYTAFPFGDCSALKDWKPDLSAPIGIVRKVIEPGIPHEYLFRERWTSTVDKITGTVIDIRKAKCGAGCYCAMEVRVIR